MNPGRLSPYLEKLVSFHIVATRHMNTSRQPLARQPQDIVKQGDNGDEFGPLEFLGGGTLKFYFKSGMTADDVG